MSISTIPKKFVVFQDTEPTNPFNGQIWVRETDGATFKYFNGEWEPISEEIGGLDSISKPITEDEMENAVNSEEKMEQITNYELTMNKVMSKVMTRTKVLLSDFDFIWTKEPPSSKCWEIFNNYPRTEEVDGHEFKWTLEDNNSGGILLQVANIGDDTGSETFKIYEITIDSDDASEFVIEVTDNDESNRDFWINQDDTQIYSGETNDGEVQVSISSSGKSTISIYADLSSAHDKAEYYFNKLRLN